MRNIKAEEEKEYKRSRSIILGIDDKNVRETENWRKAKRNRGHKKRHDQEIPRFAIRTKGIKGETKKMELKFLVKNKDQEYIVTLNPLYCTCKSMKYNRAQNNRICKHAQFVIDQLSKDNISLKDHREELRRKDKIIQDKNAEIAKIKGN